MLLTRNIEKLKTPPMTSIDLERHSVLIKLNVDRNTFIHIATERSMHCIMFLSGPTSDCMHSQQTTNGHNEAQTQASE